MIYTRWSTFVFLLVRRVIGYVQGLHTGYAQLYLQSSKLSLASATFCAIQAYKCDQPNFLCALDEYCSLIGICNSRLQRVYSFALVTLGLARKKHRKFRRSLNVAKRACWMQRLQNGN